MMYGSIDHHDGAYSAARSIDLSCCHCKDTIPQTNYPTASAAAMCSGGFRKRYPLELHIEHVTPAAQDSEGVLERACVYHKHIDCVRKSSVETAPTTPCLNMPLHARLRTPL